MTVAKILVYLTILSTYALIVWGAYLTAGDWGLGCGPTSGAISSGWPYCNGSLNFPNPASNYGAFVEYMHRTLSIVASLFLVASTVAVARLRPRPTAATRALLLSIVLLIIQVGLGDVVVDTSLNPIVTALHLANATALFGVMVIAGVLMYQREKRGSAAPASDGRTKDKVTLGP